MCRRFNYLKYGYLRQETRLIEAETKGEQQQMPSEGIALDDISVLARGVTSKTWK